MTKYEIKFMLEQMTSSVDRLTDALGKQTYIISDLWSEIGSKQEKIVSQSYEIKDLTNKLNSYRRKFYNDKLDEAKFEKSFKDFVGESTDN